MEIHVNIFPYILSFSGFKTCVDFTRIAASNTTSDDVTN